MNIDSSSVTGRQRGVACAVVRRARGRYSSGADGSEADRRGVAHLLRDDRARWKCGSPGGPRTLATGLPRISGSPTFEAAAKSASKVLEPFFRATGLAAYFFLYAHARVASVPVSSVAGWVVLIVAVDFFYYVFHRASHRVNFLWASHVVHHQSEEYNLAVALRQSWIEPPRAVGLLPPAGDRRLLTGRVRHGEHGEHALSVLDPHAPRAATAGVDGMVAPQHAEAITAFTTA